jgi:hypothetical protein
MGFEPSGDLVGPSGAVGSRRPRRRAPVHAVGMLAPLIPGHIGCIVIGPDRSQVLARAVPDPLAD